MELMNIKKFSDCKMYCYRLLLSYYGIEIKEHEMFGIGEGMDFNLINVSSSDATLYCPLGRKLNLELNYLQKVGVRVFNGKFVKEDGKNANINNVKSILKKYGPLVVNIDRYYLDYLECDKAHMGFHSILISEYNDEHQTFAVYDALAKKVPVSLKYDDFLNGVFSQSVLSPNAEYYYINEPIQLKKVDKKLIADSLNNIAKRMINTSIPKVEQYLDYVNVLRKSYNGELRVVNYLEIQCKLFQNSFVEQEISHMFYRDLFFEFIEKYCENKRMRDLQTEKVHHFMILNDIHIEYTNGNTESILKNTRKLIKVEKNIFEMISKKEFI